MNYKKKKNNTALNSNKYVSRLGSQLGNKMYSRISSKHSSSSDLNF